MFRLKILLTGLGGFLAFTGIQEFRVSRGTTVEPLAVELSSLESGTAAANNHVLIGEHVAVYGGSVYEYSQDDNSSRAPGAHTKVRVTYYPVISEDHTFFEQLNKLSEKHGTEDAIPDADYPTIDDFKVLIKTKRFKTIGSIPDGLSFQDRVQGLIVTSIDGLDREEKQLIHESFPNTDVENIIMIMEGREPASLGKSLGMCAGGSVMALLGVFSLFFLRRS